MVGLVIAAHGHLAAELVSTAEQIVGHLSGVMTCSVEPGASPDEIRTSIKLAVKSVDDGAGVLVMADLLGGSPCTQSMSLCGKAMLEVVTGVNLPMLIKANSMRREGMSVKALAEALVAYGQRNIALASAMLRDVAARTPAA